MEDAMYRLLSLAGIIVFIVLALLMSENRKLIKWRIIYWGVGLQVLFALIMLKTSVGSWIFNAVNILFYKLISFSDKGASFLFGQLVNDTNIGAVVAFKVLPIIIFVSCVVNILYFLGIMQFSVKIMAKVMHKTMKISGAESLVTALFIFMGIECITTVKAYIEKMTKSELFTLMSAFMATIASSVMATYVSFGVSPGHLFAASVMSAPAAVLISKVMIPESGTPETLGSVTFDYKSPENNVIEAAANGASDGLKLALQVGAMLIAFVGLIWMIDGILGLLGTSFEQIAGYIFSPFAFIMGVPLKDAHSVGQLLGTKTVFNEFLAYLKMKEMVEMNLLSARSIVISTYALCGFANFGSLAILLGGIGAIAPLRKSEAAKLGIKAIISGTLACFITACIAGIMI